MVSCFLILKRPSGLFGKRFFKNFWFLELDDGNKLFYDFSFISFDLRYVFNAQLICPLVLLRLVFSPQGVAFESVTYFEF